MPDNKKSACWIGLHVVEIYKELPLVDLKGSEVGLVIINRCANCGKLNHSKIKTVEPSYN